MTPMGPGCEDALKHRKIWGYVSQMKSNIPIILLAAGQSSRMRGRDKLLERVDNQPLLRRQACLALAVTGGPVFITLPPAPHPRYDVLAGLTTPTLVPVPDAADGINASLKRGFAMLPHTCKAVMVLLSDLPELNESDLKKVLQAVDLESGNTIWRGATSAGKPGHPTVFAACHFARFAALSGDVGGRDIVAAAADSTVLVPLPDNHALLDLDTPEEWEAWRRTNT